MTISDIAKLAGVSSAAVSRYLNGGPLSEQKRAVIQAVVEQTGYSPDTAARSRSTGTKQSRGTASRSKKQQTGGESKVALGIILAALVLGLIARAISMGLL